MSFLQLLCTFPHQVERIMEQMAEMFQRLGMRSTLGSPHTPLLGFETTGGTVDDPEYAKACEVIGGHHLSGETMWLDGIGAAGEWKVRLRIIPGSNRRLYDVRSIEIVRASCPSEEWG
jgi:hypothetical protein